MGIKNWDHMRVAQARMRAAFMIAAVVIPTNFASACVDHPVRPRQASVEITFRGLVNRSPDLPDSALDCARSVLVTRVHASWQSFSGVAMVALPPDMWQMQFHDVPTGQSVRFRINDKNWCDRNATGAVLDGVSANGVQLVRNATTPGANGEEPGFAFTVDAEGRVQQ